MYYYNREKDITVDIAARQSGKTTRLCNDAMRYAMNRIENCSVIICYDRNMIRTLYDRYSYGRYPYDRIHILTYREFFTNPHRIFAQHRHPKLFFDEFGLYQQYFERIYENAYYSTTIVSEPTNRRIYVDPLDYEEMPVNNPPRAIDHVNVRTYLYNSFIRDLLREVGYDEGNRDYPIELRENTMYNRNYRTYDNLNLRELFRDSLPHMDFGHDLNLNKEEIFIEDNEDEAYLERIGV